MSFSLADYLEELRPLIDVDSGTFTTDGIKVIVTNMEQKYLDMGWTVKRIDCGIAGTALEARNKPEAEHIDVLLLGHMDTVFPVGTVAKRPMTNDTERAYGPGVADMKGGLLSMVYALRTLDQTALDKLSICVFMNPDEEVGSIHSEARLASVAVHAKQVLVAEPARADGSLVKARKGRVCYRLKFNGKAAHAGNDPQNGRSAITEMAHWILALNKFTNFTTGTTINVGTVKGGTGANTVPDFAEAVVDVRFWDNDVFAALDTQIKTMAATPFLEGVTAVIESESYKPSMTPTKQTEALMAIVETAGQELGIAVNWLAAGGGSDANFTAKMGIPSLDGFGPIGGGFHSDKEYMELTSVEPRIRLLQKILIKLAS